jgi:twinkle protein
MSYSPHSPPLTLEDDDIDFDRYMRETETAHKVKRIEAYEDDINREFDDVQEEKHPKLPWCKSWIALRPGELSLWFGFNGHGKSLVLGQAVLSLVDQGERACICSFEMKPRKTLARMARQHADAYRPTPEAVSDFVKWGAGRIWVYDQSGSVEPEKVYAVIRYAADQLKCTHFVIDNLSKFVSAEDDYAGQKSVVEKLWTLALDLNIHIHLVHHSRKARDESIAPRKMDSVGSGAITNAPDNVFIIWRNKAKQEALTADPSRPDATFMCDKQRHGSGLDGVQNLSFHARSQQFIEFGKFEAQRYGDLASGAR